MKHRIPQTILALLLTVLVAAGLFPLAAFADETDREPSRRALQTLEQTGAYLVQAIPQPSVGSVGGEWAVLGLARAEYPVPEGYFDTYLLNLEQALRQTNGVLHDRKYTEYSRTVLALTALGCSPCDVAGYDLLAPLTDFDKVIWQGINGPIFALLALDAGDHSLPPAPDGVTPTSRDALIHHILGQQLPDGGWSFGGSISEPDTTAMAIQALAPYATAQPKVGEAMEQGLTALSAMQNDQGGFGPSSEACSQVLVAVTALGIDPEADARFIKDGHSVLDGLLAFCQEDGSFLHVAQGGADRMATEQAFYALAAYGRYCDGKTPLYDMSDVSPLAGTPLPDTQLGDTSVRTEQEHDPMPPMVWLWDIPLVLAIGFGLAALHRNKGR